MLCLLSLYFVKVIILLVFGVEGGGGGLRTTFLKVCTQCSNTALAFQHCPPLSFL